MNHNILYTSLETFATQNAKKTFAQINGTKYSYAQLVETINKLQTLFKQNQLVKGDRIILSSKDDYFTSTLFLACLKYGLTTVFIDPELPPHSANPLIQKAKAKGIIQDENLNHSRSISEIEYRLDIKEEKQKKGKLFNRLLKSKKEESKQTNTFPAILQTLSPTVDTSLISDSDIAYIIFTSGTTAQPKGVMISYKNVMTHLKTLSETYELNSDSKILNNLMLYHADGIIQGPLLTLCNHATWHNPFKFDIAKLEDLFYSIYKYDISHFITVPTVLSFMDKFSDGYEDSFEHEGFKTVVSVASKLEVKLWTNFEKKFKTTLINVYGLTETVAGSLFSGISSDNRKIGTVGKPIDCMAKITNENHQEVEIGTPGQLWLKGDHIFSGYLNDSESTSATFEHGWLKTGDIATKDSEGFYNITGRLKNVINTGGVNIYPEQITEAINTHPQVLESVCFGIEDDFFGEKIAVAIVSKSPNTLNDSNTVIEFLRPLLHHHQIPKEFYFLDDLPKGLSGKVQLNKIKSIVKEKHQTETTQTKSYNSAILKAASKAFGIPSDQLTINDNSASVDGWDSMGHLIFITELENVFQVQFSTSEIMRMNSLKTVNMILKQKLEVHE